MINKYDRESTKGSPAKIIPPEKARKLIEKRKKIALDGFTKALIKLLESTPENKMIISEAAKKFNISIENITAMLKSEHGNKLTIEGSDIKLKAPPKKPIILLPLKY